MKKEKMDDLMEKHKYLWSSVLSPIDHYRSIESTTSMIDNNLFQMYRETDTTKELDKDEVAYLSQMKFFYLSYSSLSQQLESGCEAYPIRSKYLVSSIEMLQAMALELFGQEALLKMNRGLLNQTIRRGVVNEIAAHLIAQQDISELNARFSEINPQSPREMKTDALEHPLLTAISYRNSAVLTLLENKGLKVSGEATNWDCDINEFLRNIRFGKNGHLVHNFDRNDTPITIAWIMASLLLGEEKNIWSAESAQTFNKEKRLVVEACKKFGWWDDSPKASEAISDFQIRMQITSNSWKNKKPAANPSSITVTPRVLRSMFSIIRTATNPDGGDQNLVARSVYDWMASQDIAFWESSGAKADPGLMKEWLETNYCASLRYSRNTGDTLRTAILELQQLDQISDWLGGGSGPMATEMRKIRKDIIQAATNGIDEDDLEMFEAEVLELSSCEHSTKMAKRSRKRM